MSREPVARARYPEIAPEDGHYESFYLKAGHPEQPLAVWIRYTVHKRPGLAAHGSIWFTTFDGQGEGPLATKATLPPAELSVPPGGYIRIGEATFAPDRVEGSVASELLAASWKLEVEPGGEPYRHLPREWMYRAQVPRTKLESPQPGARVSGVVGLDERRIELDGWPGMVGHNWGAQHAERWIWLHGSSFGERDRRTWFDAALGRIKLGPLTTPWIGNAMLSLDGERHRLGGIERIRSTEVGETPRGCELAIAGTGVTVFGSVRADPKDLVGWLYADPDGPEHHTVNCSIARMRLVVRRDGRPDAELETAHGATYELGMRERDHGIPIQPFPDG